MRKYTGGDPITARKRSTRTQDEYILGVKRIRRRDDKANTSWPMQEKKKEGITPRGSSAS